MCYLLQVIVDYFPIKPTKPISILSPYSWFQVPSGTLRIELQWLMIGIPPCHGVYCQGLAKS